MFVIYYGGGLGNKMFEYAFSIALREEYPEVDIRYFDTLKNVVWYRSVQLDKVFKIRHKINEISNAKFKKITGEIAPPLIFKILNRDNKVDYTNVWYKINDILNKNSEKRKSGDIIVRRFQYVPIGKLDLNKDIFFGGIFCNFRYFDKYRDKILEEFSFKHKYNEERIKNILTCNSVAVHIRRGDHVTISNQNKQLYNCDLCDCEYYKKAILIMKQKVEQPVFYFFTDDKEYVKKHYSFVRNKKIIRSKKDYLDLELMSLCKHAIIANSTFSFWGAYLNRNENKVVIAPNYYEYRNGKGIVFECPNDWITVEV